MTREKAHKRIDILFDYSDLDYNKFIKLVDDIFDNFESRICKNCKWFNPTQEDLEEGILEAYIDCGRLYIEEKDGVQLKDFGCNRFESKR